MVTPGVQATRVAPLIGNARSVLRNRAKTGRRRCNDSPPARLSPQPRFEKRPHAIFSRTALHSLDCSPAFPPPPPPPSSLFLESCRSTVGVSIVVIIIIRIVGELLLLERLKNSFFQNRRKFFNLLNRIGFVRRGIKRVEDISRYIYIYKIRRSRFFSS